MTTVTPSPPRVDLDFTDARLTAQGGLAFLARMGRELELPRRLAQAIQLKRRRRGASDGEMLWSLVASLAAGNGSLSDLDALRVHETDRVLLGLEAAPSGRRLGEYLARFQPEHVDALLGVARGLVRQVAASVIEGERDARGYVPVFIDGTAIEVDGELFEGAAPGYDGQPQYWLHGVFVGGLWASGRLHPGGVEVAAGWQEQLEADVAPLFEPDTPVWLHADNAYYRRSVVEYCAVQGWEYSISVTHPGFKRPILEVVEGLPDSGWEEIGLGERATLVRHRPEGWQREHGYVVVRRYEDGPQRRLIPRDIVILVSRTDLPLAELVARHRQKQGQENAFKGPLIDLDLHHPPCRRFDANRAFYACGQLAQVLLRAIQFRWLPRRARRHGLRPLIRRLIRTAARLVHTGRRWRLDFDKCALRLDWLLHASVQLE